jgi:hypothetical protein
MMMMIIIIITITTTINRALSDVGAMLYIWVGKEVSMEQVLVGNK